MDVKIKLCCSSFDPTLCAKVENKLHTQFNKVNDTVNKVDGMFEHIITTQLSTYDEAEKLVDEMYEKSNGQIALIEYVVTNHK